MRRLILLLALLACLPAAANAAISRTGSCAATATSCTLSAVNTGDLVVGWAFRNGSTTAPSTPTSNTSVDTNNTGAGGTVGSYRIWCRVASSSGDTGSGAATNATAVFAEAFSGTPVISTALCNTTGIGNFTHNSAKTSTSASFNTFTVSDANNWVLGFLGDTGSSLCTPTGMTSVASSGTVGGNDTNGTVSSWSTTTCTVTSSTWMTWTGEVLGMAAPTGVAPIRVQVAQCSTTTGAVNQIITTRDCRFNQGTLTSNRVVAFVDYSITLTPTESFQNDKADTLALEKGQTDATNAQRAEIWCVAPTAGSLKYTMTFSGQGGGNQARNVRMVLVEYKNMSSCTPDATAGASGSSTTLNAGNLGTLANANDLIVQYGTLDSASSNTSWTAATNTTSINWIEDGQDINVQPFLFEWGQYGTKNPLTPIMTQNPTGGWVTVAAAFPVATGGTAPSGLYVVRRQNMNTQNETAATVTLPYPLAASGDGLILTKVNETGYDISSITDSNGNTWTRVGTGDPGTGNISGTEIWKAPNISTSTTASGNIITVHLTGSTGGAGSTMMVHEFSGADTTTLVDNTVGYISQTNTQTVAGDVTVCSACMTPPSGEIVVASGEVSQNSATDVTSPAGWVFTGGTFTPRVVPDFDDENNMWSLGLANGSALTVKYSQDSSNTPGIGFWYWNAVAVKAAGGAGPVVGGAKQMKLSKLSQNP